MTDDEAQKLTAAVRTLGEELTNLARMAYLNNAKLQAVQGFAVAKIADATGQDRKSLEEEIDLVTRQIYDEQILYIGERFPRYAETIDFRTRLEGNERERWYFPEDGK